MKEILNEWKKYLAEQADGTDQREISGKTDAEEIEDKVVKKFLEFGKELRPQDYRQALQDFKEYAPRDDEYYFIHKDLGMILRAAINPEKTNPELLKKIATGVDEKMSNLAFNLEEREKAMKRYMDLVEKDRRLPDDSKRFNSSDVGLIALLDAGAHNYYL